MAACRNDLGRQKHGCCDLVRFKDTGPDVAAGDPRQILQLVAEHLTHRVQSVRERQTTRATSSSSDVRSEANNQRMFLLCVGSATLP